MTLEDLKEEAAALHKEMEVFFSTARTKAGSRRVRVILNALKRNATQLKKDLMQADEK